MPKPVIVDVEQGFHAVIATPEISKLAQNSVGLNFRSQRLPPGFATWAKDKPIPVLLRPTAAEIFAFDVLIQNADRRQVNPNLLTNGDKLRLWMLNRVFQAGMATMLRSASYDSYLRAKRFIEALPANFPAPEVAADPDGEGASQSYTLPTDVKRAKVGFCTPKQVS